jgi:hypothetical protein
MNGSRLALNPSIFSEKYQNPFEPIAPYFSRVSTPSSIDQPLANVTNENNGMRLRSKRIVPGPDQMSPSKKRRLRRKRNIANLAKANEEQASVKLEPTTPTTNHHFLSPPISTLDSFAKQLDNHFGIKLEAKATQAIATLSERAAAAALQSALDLLNMNDEKPDNAMDGTFDSDNHGSSFHGRILY